MVIFCCNFSYSHEKTRKYYDVAQWVGHHHWDTNKIVYDVAVIQVKENIQFNERVKPIKFSSTLVPAGVTVTLTGWGKIHVSIVRSLLALLFIITIHN